MSEEAVLLRMLVGMTARLAYPEDRLREIVSPNGSIKLVHAYNLCDGTHVQSEIAKGLALDQGQLSRAVTKWVAAGVVHRVPDGKDTRLLHVYALPETLAKSQGDRDAFEG